MSPIKIVKFSGIEDKISQNVHKSLSIDIQFDKIVYLFNYEIFLSLF